MPNPTMLPAWARVWCQDLTYVEFFAGEGQVWRAVRADYHPSVAVDLCYMEGQGTAMDILSNSGFAFYPQVCIYLFSLFWFQGHVIANWILTGHLFQGGLKWSGKFPIPGEVFFGILFEAQVGNLAYLELPGKPFLLSLCDMLQQLGTCKSWHEPALVPATRRACWSALHWKG